MISLLVTVLSIADPGSPAAIGAPIDASSIRFKDTRCLERSLDDLGPRKATVLVFVTNDCPLVQRYYPVLRDMDRKFRGKGVVFAAANVGVGDAIRDVARQPI